MNSQSWLAPDPCYSVRSMSYDICVDDVIERPLCPCHGAPMLWHKTTSKWKCRIAAREYRQRWNEKHPGYYSSWRENNRERKRKMDRIYFHRADGGWLKQRKRQLASQREDISKQLDAIAKEIELVP